MSSREGIQRHDHVNKRTVQTFQRNSAAPSTQPLMKVQCGVPRALCIRAHLCIQHSSNFERQKSNLVDYKMRSLHYHLKHKTSSLRPAQHELTTVHDLIHSKFHHSRSRRSFSPTQHLPRRNPQFVRIGSPRRRGCRFYQASRPGETPHAPLAKARDFQSPPHYVRQCLAHSLVCVRGEICCIARPPGCRTSWSWRW